MPVCPNCYRRALVKVGKYGNHQRWRCQFCWKTTIYPRRRRPKGLVIEAISDDMKDSIFILESRTHYGDWLYNETTSAFLSDTMGRLIREYGFYGYWAVPDPIIVRCSFYAGFWCGKDNDLICIAPLEVQETKELDPYLSPEGRTPMGAIKQAVAKRKAQNV